MCLGKETTQKNPKCIAILHTIFMSQIKVNSPFDIRDELNLGQMKWVCPSRQMKRNLPLMGKRGDRVLGQSTAFTLT